jgi:hypothetical protein
VNPGNARLTGEHIARNVVPYVSDNMNNSQFWTWVDYWECWDFMQDELEDELELEDWADEALWLICLKCGNPLEGCVC